MPFTVVPVVAHGQLSREHHQDDDTDRPIHGGTDSSMSVQPGDRRHSWGLFRACVAVWLHISNRAYMYDVAREKGRF